jgi:hypothetical protein
MKTIVIRPEVIAYHNASFRDPKPPVNRALAAVIVLLPLVAVAGWLLGRSSAPAAPTIVTNTRAASAPAAAISRVARIAADGSVELMPAVEDGTLKAEFTGNGRELVAAEIFNPSTTPVTVRVSFGQHFTCGKNTVVATRNAQTTLAPGQTAKLDVPTAATRSLNRVGPGTYRLSAKTAPRIDLLLGYAQEHPELSAAAIQTGVLALLENLPLSSVCKFTAAGSDLPSRFDTGPFRAETLDVLAALGALREIGIRDRDLAMTVDPQLKIEAMIDPGCRAAAMRYYGISSENEWAFWKTQLLEGDPATRHYALYGIARFYPEIALEMLPKWAREKRTTPVFRLTAVQALAETNRSAALVVLSDLVNELGRNTELGRAAFDAAQLLDSTLRKTAETPRSVAFRGTLGAGPF